MADEELSKALKDLHYKVQISSLKQRRSVFGERINEGIIKGICKVLVLTLPRYKDTCSQQYVKDLIVALIEKHTDVTIRSLTSVLLSFAEQYKKIVVTHTQSKTALFALQWSILIVTKGWKYNKEVVISEMAQIVELQAYLFTVICEDGNNKRCSKAYNLLNNVWGNVQEGEKLYLETIKKMEQTHYLSVLASAIAKHLSSTKCPILNDYLDHLIDTFIKSLVSCKTRPSPNVIMSCYPLLSQLDDDRFKRAMLPALQKAMLRNPEIILECVGLVISGVELDLSKYAVELGNSLIANLHSKDDKARLESADACKRLASKIRNYKALEELLKKTFDVFHGSVGKLTVVDYKISVLQGAANFSYNSVEGEDSQKLVLTASEHFVKVLEVEVHEKTLCHTLDTMAMWTCKFLGDIPKKVIDAFKNGLNMKTSTPLVKISYIQCMLATCNSKTITCISPLFPILLKSVEKAAAQPAVALSVTEGLCAAVLLLRLAHSQQEKDSGLHNMWNVVLDMDKQIFVSDKFLTTCSEESLVYVMQLCEILLVQVPEKVKNPEPLHKAVLHCCTISSSENRKKCLAVLKQVVSSLSGASIARDIFKEMPKYLDTHKIATKSEKDAGENKENDGSSGVPSRHSVVECIRALLTSLDPNMWNKIVRHLGCRPKELVGKRATQFRQMLVENYKYTLSNENALATLVSVNPDILLPEIISKVVDNLEDPSICQISRDDYFIYLTPEGELYDKSVVPGDETMLKELEKGKQNQLEEQQLRRELEEKKRKEGKIKPPQYTLNSWKP
nr:unnamed protein product [Callosobruchus chinensis]